MTAAELFTLGFLLVIGAGCITAAIHSINLAGRITTRYQAARNIQDRYFAANTPTHTCSFDPCAVATREADRLAAQDRLR